VFAYKDFRPVGQACRQTRQSEHESAAAPSTQPGTMWQASRRRLGSRGAREIERRVAERWRHAAASTASADLVNQHVSPTPPVLQGSSGARRFDEARVSEGPRRPELSDRYVKATRESLLMVQATVLPDIARCGTSTTTTTAEVADAELVGMRRLHDFVQGTSHADSDCIGKLGFGRTFLFSSSVQHCFNDGPRRKSPHQYEAVSFFSSSALKTKGDEGDRDAIRQPPPVVKARPEAPRRHRNLLKPLEKTRIPTPNSAPESMDPLNQLSKTTTKGMVRKGLDLIIGVCKAVLLFTMSLPGNILYFAMRPTESKERIQGLWATVKHEANHYWVGTKLLWEEIKTARMLVGKTLGGTALTRRERKQLLRTVSDLFRLIPFSMFVIIPFMEFALPFALRLFPNMLPSTYQDSLKAEENMKRELKSRIAMAQFFQEYVC
jgi:hypothetical protein